MSSPRRPTFPFDAELVARVRILIGTRLALMLIFVLAGWFWIHPTFRFSLADLPGGLILLVIASLLLAQAYILWLKYFRTLLWQIRAQFLIDTVLITVLVLETGDLISPYIMLYVVVIAVGGFFLGRADAYIISAACAACFSILPVIMVETSMHSFAGDVYMARTAQIVAVNDAAFLFVGLLAARIADRRQDRRRTQDDRGKLCQSQRAP